MAYKVFQGIQKVQSPVNRHERHSLVQRMFLSKKIGQGLQVKTLKS